MYACYVHNATRYGVRGPVTPKPLSKTFSRGLASETLTIPTFRPRGLLRQEQTRRSKAGTQKTDLRLYAPC